MRQRRQLQVLALGGCALFALSCVSDIKLEPSATQGWTLATVPTDAADMASSDPAYLTVSPVMRRAIPADILAELAATKGRLTKAPPRKALDSTAALIHAAALPASTDLSVIITLDDPPFDFSRIRIGDELARSNAIAERKTQLAPSQGPIISALATAGATQVSPFWMTNAILANVPAGRVTSLAAIPGVQKIELSPTTILGDAYDNLGFRTGTRTTAFINAGITASNGGRAAQSTPVRIAVVDAGFPDRNHVAFKSDGSIFATSRIAKVADCRTGTCTPTAENGISTNHGHKVSVAAMASIELNQDPTFPGTFALAQTQRSGMAPAARLYYYEQSNGGSFLAGVQQAVADGADVINFSLTITAPVGAPSSACNAAYDWGGANSIFANALAAGALPVGCGGNDGSTTSCSIWYPALRPDALSVLALGSLNSSTPYDSLVRAPYANMGGMQLTRWDGYTNPFYTTAAVDLMTAADVTLNPTSAPANYSAVDQTGGCSLASPRVAGVAALMKHALKSVGWSTDARVVQLAMLITGDGWNGANPGAKTAVGVSDSSGYGRVHAHWPSSTNMVSPWAWGWRTVTVNNGEEVCWTVGDSAAEPAGVTHWKWVGTWYEPDLQAVADIDTRVYNACPGQPRQLLYSDSGYDLRSRVQLRQADIQGKCLQMCTYGYSVPPGGRTFWSMDYFHGGNPDDH